MCDSASPSKQKKESLVETKARLKKTMASEDFNSAAKVQEAITDVYQVADEAAKVERFLTGISYDHATAKHKCEWDSNYPENPQRYFSIINRLVELDLMVRCQRTFEDREILSRIQSVHTGDRLQLLSDICSKDLQSQKHEAIKYDAIYFNEATAEAAKIALALSYNLVKNVATGDLQNGLAVVRPPGHHAMPAEFCGYCYVNNVAVSARSILDDKDIDVNKILILDFDVHHGQATQQMFYDTDKVLYISIHRYEHGNFWPHLRQSNYDFIGKPKSPGYGYNVNIPLNTVGCGDAEYMAILTNIIMPMAFEFQPDLIIFSAGYDACIGCPEGEMTVTPAFYGHIIKLLSGMAKGKLAVILEGGYYLPSLAEGVAMTLKALLDDPTGLLNPLGKPNDSVVETINNVIGMLHNKWKCFNYKLRPTSASEPVHQMHIRHERAAIEPPFPVEECYPVQPQHLLDKFAKILDSLKLRTVKLRPTKVGYAYNDEMLRHQPRDNSIHPECPERLQGVYDLFKELGLDRRCIHISHSVATTEHMALVHDRDFVKKLCKLPMPSVYNIVGKLAEGKDAPSSSPQDVYVSSDTLVAVSRAVGCVLDLCRAVMDGVVGSGIALVRPPGHHAERNCAAGFCLVNNVAVAAKWIQQTHPGERILILDFDIHHGNGTQHMFYEDDQVLFISIHKFENGQFYPGLQDGGATFVGTGKGTGYNCNIPFNNGKMGDAEYIAIFHGIILPIAYSFAPTVVLVSAGFDAGVNDRLGNYAVSPQAFGHFVQLLRPLASGRVILAMEGGYNLTTLKYGMIMCAKALLGDPLPPLQFAEVSQHAKSTIQEVINIQREYWKVLDVIRPLTPNVQTIYLNNGQRETSLDDDIGSSNERYLNLCSLNQDMFPGEFKNVPTYK